MPTTKPKVLLVDDSNSILELEKDFLARTPAEILTARSGAEALQKIRQERPQLVYLGVTLPDISGTECCRQIKSDPELRLTPIILIFAAAQVLTVDTKGIYGCDEALAKPLERKTFLNCGYRFLFGIERRGKRVPCPVPIHCRFEHVVLESSAIDVSSHGVYVRSNLPVLPGTEITVKFKLPVVEEVAIEGHGRIAWVNQGTHSGNLNIPQGFGVHLLQFSPSSRTQLAAFVSSVDEQEANRRENEVISLDRSRKSSPTPDRQLVSSHEPKNADGMAEH